MTVQTLLATLKAKNYFFSDSENHLNIIAVRSTNQRAGKFDDKIYGLVMRDDEWRLYEWTATTDPSTSYLQRPINRSGCAILVPGQYLRTYRVDSHNGWCRTLCQRGAPVRVFRDNDRDQMLDMNMSSIQSGMFGINLHWDRNEPSGRSGVNYRASAGCQVFRYKKDHTELMQLVDRHVDEHGTWFDYTLLLEEDLVVSLDSELDVSKLTEGVVKRVLEESVFWDSWADWVVKKEGRFDKDGNLLVYSLPSGDGGGSYEIAGINARYHPEMAAQLRALIESGLHGTAASYAKQYLTEYTKGVAKWHPNRGVQAFLRDCAFNRGPTGAARIYQIALNVVDPTIQVDGKVGPHTMDTGRKVNPTELVIRLSHARQAYERTQVKRNEASKFWRGLTNRWVDCTNMALLNVK